MNRIVSLLLALTLVFALAACGSKDAENDAATQEPGVVAPVGDDTNPPAEEMDDNGAAGENNTGNTTNVSPNSTNTNKPSTSGSTRNGGSSSNHNSPSQKPSTGGSSGSTSSDQDDLTTLMGKLMKGTDGDMKVETKDISPDAFPSDLFIDYIEGAKAVSSSAMMSSVAHSVCLLKVPDGTDAAKVADQMNKNKDPRKWICVEAEKALVLQKGNYILLAMSTTDIVDTVSKNFKAMF